MGEAWLEWLRDIVKAGEGREDKEFEVWCAGTVLSKLEASTARIAILEEELKRASDWLTNASGLLKAYGDIQAADQMMYSAKLARRELPSGDKP